MEKFKAVFIRFGAKSGKSYLYIAPYDERIREGDTVVVPHNDGSDGQATVVYEEDINLQYSTHRDQWEMFKKIAGVVEGEIIKKVKAVIKRTDFEYDDEEEESEDEEN